MKTDEPKISGLKCGCLYTTVKILCTPLGQLISAPDQRGHCHLLWENMETPRNSLDSTGQEAPELSIFIYYRTKPSHATVECTKAWHLHIHICGGGCQSRRTQCQIIGRLSKGIQRYAPGVSQAIFQLVKGFRIKLTVLDSFFIQFYLLLLRRVVERRWSCLFLFYLAAVMHGARLVSKGVEKVRRQLEVADGGFQTRLKSQPASFLSFPASFLLSRRKGQAGMGKWRTRVRERRLMDRLRHQNG